MDLSRANNDMENLQDSIDIFTLFLDYQLNVRSFTSQTSKIFNLLSGDTGRSIMEKFIPSDKGRWYIMKIMPYRTLDNRIDGVVVTFMNVKVARKTGIDLREKQSQMGKRIQKLEQALNQAHNHQ
jgi:two-component system CheB/CheR fusion protein